MYHVGIHAMGRYVPEKVVTNADFEKKIDTTDEWIRSRTGIEERRYAADDIEIPGLMHANLGGYHVRDIEFTAAFDVVASKVGKDLSEAIWAEPNNTIKFAEVPHLGIPVYRGMTHDGLGKYLKQVVEKAPGPTDDVSQILKDTQTDVVVNLMPVGSEMATK